MKQVTISASLNGTKYELKVQPRTLGISAETLIKWTILEQDTLIASFVISELDREEFYPQQSSGGQTEYSAMDLYKSKDRLFTYVIEAILLTGDTIDIAAGIMNKP